MNRQMVLAALMLVVAIFVLFLLPPAQTGSEKAFRLVVAVAAVFAGLLKLRRALRERGDRS